MASNIDETKPTAGSALTSDVRDNFSAAKTEIEALQTDKAALADLASTDTDKGSALVGNTIQVVASKAVAVTIAPSTTRDLIVHGTDGGRFYGVTGAASGTYSDDGGTACGTVFIPTGGNGSAAWLRQFDGPIVTSWFNADPANTGTVNAACFQAALDAAENSAYAIKSVLAPAGEYTTDVFYIPYGVDFYGEGGAAEASNRAETRFIQSGAAGDVIRLKSFQNGTYYYWYGTLRDFSIFGDTGNATGFGINCKDASGNNVLLQDTSNIHDLTIRRCPEGGINVPSGAFPLSIKSIKLLFNNGPGISLTRASTFQGVHFLDISGDGNNGGLIRLDSLNDSSGAVTITNLKSEGRVNSDYASAEHQTNAIVCVSCDNLPIVINGATHTSSIPDGAVYKKPGSLVQVTGNPPSIAWNAVAIRVRGTDTGTDPYIIGGVGGVSQPAYTQRFGQMNTGFKMFRSSIQQWRTNNTDLDTTPSVAMCNILIVTNSAPTVITQLDDGLDGQEVMLTFQDTNTTLNDGGNFSLAGNFVSTGNDVLTLICIAGTQWREKCRSVN